jgi:hypothetical protein
MPSTPRVRRPRPAAPARWRALFFERGVAAIEEPPDHTRHEALAVCIEEMVGNLGQRNVRRGLDQREDLRSAALDPSRAPVPSPPCTRASQAPMLRRRPLTNSIDPVRSKNAQAFLRSETGARRTLPHRRRI